MAAINTEISIGRENDGIGERFSHAHEAGIGEAHGHIRVLLHKLQHDLQLFCQIESKEHGTAPK